MLAAGIAGFCMHATLLGVLAGVNRWSQYGSLIVGDATGRVVVATATFLVGWGLVGYLWATVTGSIAWLVLLLLTRHARRRDCPPPAPP